ncbi:MAG: coproporphyrinogen III oxidase, partial [Aquificaceae bacterium]
YNALDSGKLPTMRGCILSEEDLLRREVIMDLMCNFICDFDKIERMFGIRFQSHFERELDKLREMEADGLLAVKDRKIKVLPEGRLLIRNIAMAFDEYVERKVESRFSRTI